MAPKALVPRVHKGALAVPPARRRAGVCPLGCDPVPCHALRIFATPAPRPALPERWPCARRRRWRAFGLLVACTLLAVLHGPASAQGRAPRVSDPALRDAMTTPLGTQPAEEMRWALVLAGLGRHDDAARLREWLLGLWLRQQSGEALPPPLPMETVLRAPAAQVVPTWERQAQAAWQRAFNQHLAARLPAAAVAVPGEIEALGDQLEPLGPGLWLRRDRSGAPRTFYAWIELVGRGSRAFPATGFTVPLAGGGLECAFPRAGAPRLLAPGEAVGLLCARAVSAAPVVTPGATVPRAPPAVPAASAAPAWPTASALAAALAAAGQAGALEPEPLWREGVRSGIAQALAAPRRAEAQAWLQQQQQAAADRMARERAEAEARSRAQARRNGLKAGLAGAAILLAIVTGFALLARRFGPGRAAGIVWVLGMIGCLPLAWMLFSSARGGGGWGALGALIGGAALVVMPTVVALLLAAGHRFVVRFVSDGSFRRQLVVGLGVLLLLMLLQVVVGRIL